MFLARVLVMLLPLFIFSLLISSFLLKKPKKWVDNLPLHPIALSHQVLIDQFVPLNATSTTVAFLCQPSFSTVVERIAHISGVPFVLTNDLNTFSGKFAYLDAGSFSSAWFTTEHVLMLKRFISHGGHILITGVNNDLSKKISLLLGTRTLTTTRNHKLLKIHPTSWNRYLEDPNEQEYTLSGIKNDGPFTTSIGHTISTDSVVATYENGSIASLSYRLGEGNITLIGVSSYDLRLRNLVGRDYNANSHYCNEFEPLSDFLPLFIKGIYETIYPDGLTLHTAPNGYQSTLIITHDVDFKYSMEKGIRKFAELELRYHTPATYFIQTKYIRDDKDEAFFTPTTARILPWLNKHGFEVGSHTVVHTKQFNKLPLGTCTEAYPTYKPFSLNQKEDLNNPTVCGELKVSKELLEGSNAEEVTSFRSGELLYNQYLPNAMERLGYKQGSDFSAEDVLSYFPYRYPYDEYKVDHESDIFEFPLSYEDEAFPPLIFRINKATKLFQQLYHNGAVFVLLIHPDRTWWNLKYFDLEFEAKFLDTLPNDVWRTTMKQAGYFWRYRDTVQWNYELHDNRLLLSIQSPCAYNGLTFTLNHNNLRLCKGDTNAFIKNNKVIVNVHSGKNLWEFEIKR